MNKNCENYHKRSERELGQSVPPAIETGIGEIVMNQIQRINRARPCGQEPGKKPYTNQPGLNETEPQKWSLAKQQRWINEKDYRLSGMQSGTDSEISLLRARVECELGRKKDLITHVFWAECVPRGVGASTLSRKV